MLITGSPHSIVSNHCCHHLDSKGFAICRHIMRLEQQSEGVSRCNSIKLDRLVGTSHIYRSVYNTFKLREM